MLGMLTKLGLTLADMELTLLQVAVELELTDGTLSVVDNTVVHWNCRVTYLLVR